MKPDTGNSKKTTTSHERYYRLGKGYWWFYGKYRLVLGLLKACTQAFDTSFSTRPSSSPIQVFDAGCGPGHFMELLQNYGEVTGGDYVLDRLVHCRSEGFEKIAQTDLRKIPFQNESFDLITAIDTIEHIQDDAQAIHELYRVLKPGGVIAITVPAFMLLWGSHDENQGHFKRYRLDEMESMMHEAGFEIVKSTYAEFLWFFALLPIRKLKALKDRFSPSPPSDDFLFFPRWINTLLTWLIVCELPLLKMINLPLGVTMICIGKKPLTNHNGEQ